MKPWRPEFIAAAFTVLLAVFAGGYFLGRSAVSQGEPVVLTSRPAPSQEEALTAPEKAPQETPAMPEEAPSVEEIDINTADAEALATLPGIGETLAKRIVAYRTENGPFTTPEELMEVEGVGEKKFAEVAELIRVGG